MPLFSTITYSVGPEELVLLLGLESRRRLLGLDTQQQVTLDGLC